jgi:hypothetical protein
MLPVLLGLLIGSPQAPPDPCAAGSVPTAPALADRLVAGSGAALGALAGGLVGGPLAIGVGAALSGTATDAAALPAIALPPLFSAVGAGGGALGAGDGAAAWAAALTGGAAATTASVTAGLLLRDGAGVIAGDRGLTLGLVVAAPALAGALAAGPTAALVVGE